MRDHLQRLFTHLVWADTQVLNSLQEIQPERCMNLFAHILGSSHTWLSRIHDTPPTIAIWPTLTFDECATVASEIHQQFTMLLETASDDELGRTVQYVTSAGKAFTSTVSDILLHVALHGSYHRGQIATSLREAGGAPVSIDFIAFARGAPAVTRR